MCEVNHLLLQDLRTTRTFSGGERRHGFRSNSRQVVWSVRRRPATFRRSMRGKWPIVTRDGLRCARGGLSLCQPSIYTAMYIAALAQMLSKGGLQPG